MSSSVMSAADVLALPQPAPDHRLVYGDHEVNFGELRLPQGDGPFPVVVVIHGGCWLAEYDLGYMSALAAALTAEGCATWSIEYRRIGDVGGGWPGTFEDVAAAVDGLQELAPIYGLDRDRVIAVGHSAGGHLALWLAARPSLDRDDPLRGASPLRLKGVVALAGIPDLAAFAADQGCGASVTELIGGVKEADAARVRRVSPIAMPAPGIPEVLIVGARDTIVPLTQATRYVSMRPGCGEILEISDAGHFELVNPGHGAWAVVRDAVLRLVAATGNGAYSMPTENMRSRS